MAETDGSGAPAARQERTHARPLDLIREVMRCAALDATEKIVLVALIIVRNNKSGDCFPSLKTIGKLAGIKSDKTVRVALGKLKKNKFVEWHPGSQRPGARHSNTYSLTLGTGLAHVRGSGPAEEAPAEPANSTGGCGNSYRGVRSNLPGGAVETTTDLLSDLPRELPREGGDAAAPPPPPVGSVEERETGLEGWPDILAAYLEAYGKRFGETAAKAPHLVKMKRAGQIELCRFFADVHKIALAKFGEIATRPHDNPEALRLEILSWFFGAWLRRDTPFLQNVGHPLCRIGEDLGTLGSDWEAHWVRECRRAAPKPPAPPPQPVGPRRPPTSRRFESTCPPELLAKTFDGMQVGPAKQAPKPTPPPPPETTDEEVERRRQWDRARLAQFMREEEEERRRKASGDDS